MTAFESRTIFREHLDSCAECLAAVNKNPFFYHNDGPYALCQTGRVKFWNIREAEIMETEATAKAGKETS
jgi:hypothetical protein